MNSFIKKKLLALYTEANIWLIERKRFLLEFNSIIEAKNFCTKKVGKALLKDYKRAFRKHRVSPSEYLYQYKFYNLSEAQRKEFLSVSTMQCAYRRLVKPDVRNVFFDKVLFLNTYSEFIHRKWLYVDDKTTYENFCSFISKCGEIIIKPIQGTRGLGIKKLKTSKIDNELLYRECRGGLVEECIVGDARVQAFHPESLNTIRIVAFNIGGNVKICGAFLRLGINDSVIDNAHAGGIFCQINTYTGRIESNGINVSGNEYKEHPNTKKKFKGFEIPQWEDCKKTVCSAMKKRENVIVAGWDVCINDKGEVEIIEGNHAPDIDIMQSPLKEGKKKYYQSILDNFGIKL